MTGARKAAWSQSVPAPATAGALWVVGVAALPFIFGGQTASMGSAVVWLGAAVAITLGLLALMPRLARLLAAGLARLADALAAPGAPSAAAFNTPQLLVVARLVVLAAEMLIVQAVLRRPIALVLAGDRQAATVEAGIAAGVLTLILPLLVWTYQTTRPMVQVATLRAIDAAIPTIGSTALTESATLGHRSPAPTLRQPTAGDETVRTSTGEVTIADARPAASDATVVSPQRRGRETASPSGATEQDASPPAGEQTVVSRHVSDKTVVSPHVDDKTVVSPPRADDPPAQAR